jgi:ABC-2 type transport system permease protein
MLRGFSAVLYKEFLHLRRDPATVIFALLIPIFQLTLFGYAIETDIRNIPTGVLDYDNSAESREFVSALENTQYARLVAAPASRAEMLNLMRAGRVRLGLEIPPGFGRGVTQRTGSQVLVLVDGSDSQTAFRAQAAVTQLALRFHNESGQPVVDMRPQVLFNPDSRTANFMVPGLIGIIMQVVTVALTAFSLVRERERGTLEQLMVSPVGRLGLLLGKLLPYGVIGIAEVVTVVVLGRLVFSVPIHGSLLLLFGLSLPFLVAALGLGLLISTFARTQAQALQGTLMLMLPSVLLSGLMFPRESMPAVIRWISFAFPVTHFIEILRGIIVRGAGFSEVWPWAAVLTAMAVAILGVATARFRKSLT